MKKYFYLLLLLLLPLTITAGTPDSTLYKGFYFNKEYNIYVELDAYEPTVVVPGQAIFGELNGYLGDKQDGRKWLFTSAMVKGDKVVLEVINDYGSEDLTATFKAKRDGTFELSQEKGATMKIARNRKWTKLPKTLEFVKQEKK